MTKKQYILKLLTALQWTWSLAEGLKILVEGNVFDDSTEQALFDILSKAVDEVTDLEAKEKLQKSVAFLQKLKATEMESKKKDEEDIQELDSMLENL